MPAWHQVQVGSKAYVHEKKLRVEFKVFRKGSERSVSVFLSFLTFRVEFFSNRFERYSGTSPFNDLYIAVAVSLLIMSSIVYQLKLRISCIALRRLLTWSSQFKLLLIITSRYFVRSTFSTLESPIKNCG